MPPLVWTRRRAIPLLQRLWAHLAPEFHCALTGSVLYRGSSGKDLDIVVYPSKTRDHKLEVLHEKLRSFGWALQFTTEQIHEKWRARGNLDEKRVEVWRTRGGHRVDVMILV